MKSINAEVSSIKAWSTATLSEMREGTSKDSETKHMA